MSRVLLVIDVQNEYFAGGAFPITHPAGHLDTILGVMDAAADAGVPTAVIRHHQPGPDAQAFKRGSDAWELHDAVAERPRDILIDKSLPGAFTHTPLADWLKDRGAETVTIAGYMTQVCCDTTARQAFHRGLGVEFLRDATGTLDVTNKAGAVSAETLHESILVAQQMFFSDVLDSAEWRDRLAA